MRTSIVSFLLCLPHLSAWLCDHDISRHAHGVARSPSPQSLLTHLYASRLARAQNLGRDGQVDPRHHLPKRHTAYRTEEEKRSNSSRRMGRGSITNAHGFPESTQAEAARSFGRIRLVCVCVMLGSHCGAEQKGRNIGPNHTKVLVISLAELTPPQCRVSTKSAGLWSE
jgi:hypothetical protein